MCTRSGEKPTILGHRHHGTYDTESKWIVEVTDRTVRGRQGISAVLVDNEYVNFKFTGNMAGRYKSVNLIV